MKTREDSRLRLAAEKRRQAETELSATVLAAANLAGLDIADFKKLRENERAAYYKRLGKD